MYFLEDILVLFVLVEAAGAITFRLALGSLRTICLPY